MAVYNASPEKLVDRLDENLFSEAVYNASTEKLVNRLTESLFTEAVYNALPQKARKEIRRKCVHRGCVQWL